MRASLFFKSVLLLLIFCSPVQAWNQKLIDAVAAFNNGNRSEKIEAVLLANIEEINLLRIKGLISDAEYQKAQGFYSDFTQDLARQVCAEQGVTMQVQPRDPARAIDAGTDSDFITTAASAEQTEAIKKEFNRRYQERVSPHVDVAPGTQWVVENDIDFMSDPNGLSQKEFKRVARANNDAYTRRNAAFYEMKVRRRQAVTPAEAADYIDEMRDFIEKKKAKSRALAERLMQLKQNPDFRKPGTATYRNRMMTEAGLQKTNAQTSKYFDRMIDANNRIGEMVGLQVAASDLPGEAKKRAPGLVDAKKREILSATVQSSNRYLDQQTRMNEALLLSVQASQNPSQQDHLHRRFVEVVKEMPPSQQGEVMARIQAASPGDDARIRQLNADLRKANTKASGPSSPSASARPGKVKPPRFADAAGIVGDIVGMAGALNDAANGKHLLINFNAADPLSVKALKAAGVALIEMAPVPVIDMMENGKKSDERIRRHIDHMVAQGKKVDPLELTAEYMAEVSVNTVGNMVIRPLLDGVITLEQGGKAALAIMDNQAAYDQLQQDHEKNQQRFDAFEKRMKQIGLGLIATRGQTPGGKTYTLLDNVHEGDLLEFSIERTDRWKAGYTVRWDISKDSAIVYSSKTLPALNQDAHRLRLVNRLPAGDYGIRFRIFDKTGKQMDYTDARMTVSGDFGMSPLILLDAQDTPLDRLQVFSDEPCTFLVKPLGRWTQDYTIEWFWDGSRLQQRPGSAPDSSRIRITPENYGSDKGPHKITVRAVKDGKIVAHEAMTVQVKKWQSITLEKNGTPVEEGTAFSTGDTLNIAFHLRISPGDPGAENQLLWQIQKSNTVVRNRTQSLSAEKKVIRVEDEVKIDTGFVPGSYRIAMHHKQNGTTQKAEAFITVGSPLKIHNIIAATRADATASAPVIRAEDTLYLLSRFDLGPGVKKIGIDMKLVDTTKNTTLFQQQITRPDKAHPSSHQEIKLKIPPSALYPGQTLFLTLTFQPGGMAPVTKQIPVHIKKQGQTRPEKLDKEPDKTPGGIPVTPPGNGPAGEPDSAPAPQKAPPQAVSKRQCTDQGGELINVAYSEIQTRKNGQTIPVHVSSSAGMTDAYLCSQRTSQYPYPVTIAGVSGYVKDINQFNRIIQRGKEAFDRSRCRERQDLAGCVGGFSIRRNGQTRIVTDGPASQAKTAAANDGNPSPEPATQNPADAKEPQQLARCRALKRDLDEAKQTYGNYENRYIALVRQFGSGWKTHPKVRTLGNRLQEIEAQAKAAKTEAAWQQLKTEHTRLKNELNAFGSQLQPILNALSGSSTTECSAALQKIMGRRDLFDSVAGPGSWSELSGLCIKMVDVKRKVDLTVRRAKQDRCNRFGDALLSK